MGNQLNTEGFIKEDQYIYDSRFLIIREGNLHGSDCIMNRGEWFIHSVCLRTGRKRKTKLNKNDQEKAYAHGSVNQYNHFAKLAVSTNSEHMHTHACMLSH